MESTAVGLCARVGSRKYVASFPRGRDFQRSSRSGALILAALILRGLGAQLLRAWSTREGRRYDDPTNAERRIIAFIRTYRSKLNP